MSETVEQKKIINKNFITSFIKELNDAEIPDIKTVLERYFIANSVVNITSPFEELDGIEAANKMFWTPLFHSFPDLENQPYILVADDYEDRSYVSCTGNFIGTFTEDWLDIPATQQPTWLRYAAHFMIEDGKITKAWYFFDVLDVMRQAGFNFFPNKGIECISPAPMTGDGIVNYKRAPIEGEKTLELTNAMLNGLGSYDGKTLSSMGQERFWDQEQMMWYGPAGIGTTRGLKGFQKNHQVPFITAFPDRGITVKEGKEYFTQIGDGNYSCDFGFPAMYGTHNGDGWLGLKATGKKITLRVVDYWRREGEIFKENWVFIDMIHVLKQLDVDVFELLNMEKYKRKNL
jgi:predicted ester cyclase